MSVNVSSQVLITTTGRDAGLEVQGDLKYLFQRRLRADSGVEWNPVLPEQLDVKSPKRLAPISPTNSPPVSPACRLSRSKVVRHGHRLSQSSPNSETINTPWDRRSDADSTRYKHGKHTSTSGSGHGRSVAGVSNSPVDVSPSLVAGRKPDTPIDVHPNLWPLTGASDSALQPLPLLTNSRLRPQGSGQQSASASSVLDTSHRLQPPSPALSHASFTTAHEEISDDEGSHFSITSNNVRVTRSGNEEQGAPPAPRKDQKSSTKVSNAEKETSFAKFKAAIRAKAKARKTKEWWEYENPASLSRICRAQNAFIPEDTSSKSVQSPRPPTPVPAGFGEVAQRIPPPTRPAPRPPVPSERVLSTPQSLNPTTTQPPPSGETVDDLKSLLAALELEISSLRQQQSQPTPSVTIAGPSRISVAYVECDVCGDSLPRSFFVDRITAKCSHKTKTCRDCLSQWISTCLESRGWDNINCPECPQLLGAFDVKRSADDEIFQRYDGLATRAYLSTLPDFRWCTAPNCGSGQLHPESTGPIFKCAACGHRYCVKHNNWHGGETCKEYEYRTGLDGGKKQKEEEASEAKLAKISKKCPGRNCGWRIEKNNGCDHMTCRKCHYEFCWQCMADYGQIRKRGNSVHLRSCKYHSDNIR